MLMEKTIMQNVIPIMVMIFVLIYAYYSNTNNKRKRKKQIDNIDWEVYYRDIPCFQNISVAYWLLYNFSDKKEVNLNNGLVTAYLLKWYQNGYIDITNKQCKYNIDLKDGNWNKDYEEDKIYSLLKNIAGNNNILEKNKIKNYCIVDKDYREEVKNVFESILKKTQNYLIENNYVKIDRSKIILSNEMINEYSHLVGLENFLLDYSNMEEKSHIELHIWENYLIFADLLGITDKIKDQFEKYLLNYRDLVEFSVEAEMRKNIIYPGIACILLILLTIIIKISSIKTSNFIMKLILILPFFYMGWLLRMHFINKKVKEMNKKTKAEIAEVHEEYYYKKRYTKDGSEYVQKKKYKVRYKYIVDGVIYTGIGKFKLRKRNGNIITVNYNEMYPEKNETALKHNYYLILLVHVAFWVLLFAMCYIILLLGLKLLIASI